MRLHLSKVVSPHYPFEPTLCHKQYHYTAQRHPSSPFKMCSIFSFLHTAIRDEHISQQSLRLKKNYWNYSMRQNCLAGPQTLVCLNASIIRHNYLFAHKLRAQVTFTYSPIGADQEYEPICSKASMTDNTSLQPKR